MQLTYLIIDIVERIFIKRIQNRRRHQKSADTHPQSITEGDNSQSKDYSIISNPLLISPCIMAHLRSARRL